MYEGEIIFDSIETRNEIKTTINSKPGSRILKISKTNIVEPSVSSTSLRPRSDDLLLTGSKTLTLTRVGSLYRQFLGCTPVSTPIELGRRSRVDDLLTLKDSIGPFWSFSWGHGWVSQYSFIYQQQNLVTNPSSNVSLSMDFMVSRKDFMGMWRLKKGT